MHATYICFNIQEDQDMEGKQWEVCWLFNKTEKKTKEETQEEAKHVLFISMLLEKSQDKQRTLTHKPKHPHPQSFSNLVAYCRSSSLDRLTILSFYPIPALWSHQNLGPGSKQRHSRMQRGCWVNEQGWGFWLHCGLSLWRQSLSFIIQSIMPKAYLSSCLNKQFNQQTQVSFYHHIFQLDRIAIIHLLTARLLRISWS